MRQSMYATYDINKSYQENYEYGPYVNFNIPNRIILKPIKLWNFTINSPLGIAAGPLLNSKYIALYAKLGFDILVYKTVRTIERLSHNWPNCLLLDRSSQLTENDIGKCINPLYTKPKKFKDISITNSFGIPSKSIEFWQEDIKKANQSLNDRQLMIVSCVGTPLKNNSLIDDFIICAEKAVEAGAKVIELNYSCPNVFSKEGKIYQDPKLSSIISKSVKKAIKDIPLIIKIGYISNYEIINKIIKANAPFIDGISAINTIPMEINNISSTHPINDRSLSKSGICGSIIKNLALKMLNQIVRIRKKNKMDFIIFGTGGVVCYEDIDDYLTLGADIVMSATGIIWNPLLGYHWSSQKCKKNI